MAVPVGQLIPELARRSLQQRPAATDLAEVSGGLDADRHECTNERFGYPHAAGLVFLLHRCTRRG